MHLGQIHIKTGNESILPKACFGALELNRKNNQNTNVLFPGFTAVLPLKPLPLFAHSAARSTPAAATATNKSSIKI